MPRPIRAIIHLSAMKKNVELVRQHIPENRKVWAVVKANAYGHGIVNACEGFSQADGMALIEIENAVACREMGWTKPILLLEGFFEPADLAVLAQYEISSAIHSLQQLAWIESSKELVKPLHVAIKLNSGMNRLGFTELDLQEAYRRVQALKAVGKIASVGVMTHFARSDEYELDHAIRQHQRFMEMASPYEWDWMSECNSAASLQVMANKTPAQWYRPGICLYGASPFEMDDQQWPKIGFIPAMTLQAQILAIQSVPANQEVGYGGRFTTQQASRIAVIACGYADGYPRALKRTSYVSLNGHLVPIVGRVSMDMMTIDVTNHPEAQVGDWVTLWGQGGPSIEEVADCADTLGYELMCALAPRVPKIAVWE